MMTNNSCCAECGEEGGTSLKACKSCKLVKYCNAECQHKHWSKHKKDCKLRAAELRDEALFKDPPPKEDCPICFLPMPARILSRISFPDATITSVPIKDFADANEELANLDMAQYSSCCGKSMCTGCVHSFCKSGIMGTCQFCKTDRKRTEEERLEELMKRVEANDAASICLLANLYRQGLGSFRQDRTKAIQLYARAVNLGYGKGHYQTGIIYHEGGDLKKAMFHFEAAAMAGDEVARYNLGILEAESQNMERAVKHWTIAASSGCFRAMHALINFRGIGSRKLRKSIDSILKAYNNSCAEMRSETRDAKFRVIMRMNESTNHA